nr:hypothetical protein [uncultured Butyrivibrio sp.]
MDLQELLNNRNTVIEEIFNKKNETRAFLHAVSSLWRHSPDNILIIYSQNKGASCVAGRKAFENLGFKVRAGERPVYILNTVVRCTDPGRYVYDDAGESIMLKEGVPQYYPEPVYESEYSAVPAFDISQLEGQVEVTQEGRPDVDKLCENAGVPIMECDRFPAEWNYYNSYYDEGDKKIMLLKSAKNDARVSAVIRAYIQFTMSGDNMQDITPGTKDVHEIKSRENAAELICYCIEAHYGIKPTAKNVSLIMQNAREDLPEFVDRYEFLSDVCLYVQRILQDLEGYPLTVEETNILNCLMTTDDPNLLLATYMRMDNQEKVEDRIKAVIARVFEQLIGPVSESELTAIYEDRIHKQIFTYPPYMINVDPPVLSKTGTTRTSIFSLNGMLQAGIIER